MEAKLLTSDFDEINRSGYCLITNGQTLLNKPNISDNFWVIRSTLVNKTYGIVEVINISKGERAIRMRNAGTWNNWILI